MKLAILKERRDGETRVAASPEPSRSSRASASRWWSRPAPAQPARLSDTDYIAAGAVVPPDTATMLGQADIVLKVRGPDAGEIAQMKKGAVLAALLAPYTDKDTPAKLAAQGVDAFAMEFMPRISRAQAMDVLSSPGQSRRLQGRDRRGGHSSAAPCR